jgi:broad specificity phosphatase PhoE
VPEVPASQWRLSETGRQRCLLLAKRLAGYRPQAIVASVEPKAVETAQLVAAQLGIAVEVGAGLHEHDRREVGWLPAAAFEAAVAALFAHPDVLVMGSETATQARERFARAVEAVLQRHTAGNVVIVAHGTVIALFVAAVAGIEPFALWQRLGLPSFVVLTLPGLELQAVVDSVE